MRVKGRRANVGCHGHARTQCGQALCSEQGPWGGDRLAQWVNGLPIFPAYSVCFSTPAFAPDPRGAPLVALLNLLGPQKVSKRRLKREFFKHWCLQCSLWQLETPHQPRVYETHILGALTGASQIRDRIVQTDSSLEGLTRCSVSLGRGGHTISVPLYWHTATYICHIEELVCLEDKDLLRD